MSRKKVGKLGTTEILLIAGGAAVVLYLVMKPKTVTPTTLLPSTYNPAAAAQAQAAASTTNTAITQGASVITDLFNNIFG